MTGILIKALKLIIKQISAPLRTAITDGLQTWKVAAAATENPWDDLLVDLLISLFDH